jgi:hypothetical protein
MRGGGVQMTEVAVSFSIANRQMNAEPAQEVPVSA